MSYIQDLEKGFQALYPGNATYSYASSDKNARLLKILPPVPFSFRGRDERVVVADLCRRLIRREYNDPRAMAALQAVLQWLVYLSSRENVLLKRTGRGMYTTGNTIVFEDKVSSMIVGAGANGYVSCFDAVGRVPVMFKSPKEDEHAKTMQVHETVLALLVMNRLRVLTTGFIYCFGGYKPHGKPMRMLIEPLLDSSGSCRSYSTFSDKLLEYANNYTPQKGLAVFSWFMQILINLEMAQASVLFTHYDLHLDNILMREGGQKKQLRLYEMCWEFDALCCEPVIIDYGHSCAWYKNQFLGMQNKYFNRDAGYECFLMAGRDVLHVIFSIDRELEKVDMSNPIRRMFSFILETFYRSDTVFCWDTGRDRPDTCPLVNFLRHRFMNKRRPEKGFNQSMAVARCPLGMIDFLWKNQNEIYRILGARPSDAVFRCLPRDKPVPPPISKSACISALCARTFPMASLEEIASIPLFPFRPNVLPRVDGEIDLRFMGEWLRAKQREIPNLFIPPRRPTVDTNYMNDELKPNTDAIKRFLRGTRNWERYLAHLCAALRKMTTEFSERRYGALRRDLAQHLDLARWRVTCFAFVTRGTSGKNKRIVVSEPSYAARDRPGADRHARSQENDGRDRRGRKRPRR
jgi:hypothetical protein